MILSTEELEIYLILLPNCAVLVRLKKKHVV